MLQVCRELCRRDEAEPVTEAGERERDPQATEGGEAQDVADLALPQWLGRNIGQPANMGAGALLAAKLCDD